MKSHINQTFLMEFTGYPEIKPVVIKAKVGDMFEKIKKAVLHALDCKHGDNIIIFHNGDIVEPCDIFLSVNMESRNFENLGVVLRPVTIF